MLGTAFPSLPSILCHHNLSAGPWRSCGAWLFRHQIGRRSTEMGQSVVINIAQRSPRTLFLHTPGNLVIVHGGPGFVNGVQGPRLYAVRSISANLAGARARGHKGLLAHKAASADLFFIKQKMKKKSKQRAASETAYSRLEKPPAAAPCRSRTTSSNPSLRRSHSATWNCLI